jgi:hypothetical protein
MRSNKCLERNRVSIWTDFALLRARTDEGCPSDATSSIKPRNNLGVAFSMLWGLLAFSSTRRLPQGLRKAVSDLLICIWG